MGTAAVSLMAFIIVLGTAFTVMGNVIGITANGGDSLRTTWQDAQLLVDSSIVPLSASLTTADVDIVLANHGRLKYAEPSLAEWEVVVRYEDGGGTAYVEYLQYASTLSAGAWTVSQIYLDEGTSTAEIYEPDIFNPNEEMVITGRLSNTPGAATINQVTISPPEGGTATVHFDG